MKSWVSSLAIEGNRMMRVMFQFNEYIGVNYYWLKGILKKVIMKIEQAYQ